MSIPRPRNKKKGKCGENYLFPSLLTPMTEQEIEAGGGYQQWKLNAEDTDKYVRMLFGAIAEAQSRLCLLEEDSGEPVRRDIGLLSFTPEVNTYGTFTIKDLEIENFNEVAQLHVYVAHVNEVKPVKATVSGAVGNSPDDVMVTVAVSGNDPSDEELTFSEGDWVLWNDSTAGSTGRGGHRFEVSRIKTINSATSWTLQRRPIGGSEDIKGYFGSWIDVHSAGIDLYKVQVKHFDWKIKLGPLYGNSDRNYLRRLDVLWPSRCVLSVEVVAELTNKDLSQTVLSSLIPATTKTAAVDLPVMPGLRTLAGQAYIMPALTGEDDVVGAVEQGKTLRNQDLASLRCVYLDARTAPQDSPITCTFKYRPIGSGTWTNIETISIPANQTNSFSNSTTNNPAKRRMPYTLNWPPPVIPQDAEMTFDVDAIGNITAGAGLVGYIQT